MTRVALALVLALAPLAVGQEGAVKLSYVDVLSQMTDLDQLWLAPHPEARCIQFASWERDSLKGLGVRETQPGDPKGWYANHDRGHYLRVEERAGKKEWVMVDCEGPGAVVRMWSANPQGTLFFYVDGSKEPVWSVDHKALTRGEVKPFTEPLAGMRARGCNFHAPIPFARHIKITCSKNDQYYQVNVRRYPKATEVESFRAELIEKHAAEIAAARERLKIGPKLDGLERESVGAGLRMTGHERDPSDHAENGLELTGPLVVRELRLKIAPPKGMTRAEQLRRLLLSIEIDGRRTVRVPVADFFGSAPGFKPYRSYPMEVTADGVGICRFPIPVAGRARIALVADGPIPETWFQLDAKFERREIPEDALAFHASWHLQKRIRTRPLSDFRVLNAHGGPGRFAGCALVVANPSEIWWGEGDEKFFVDGEAFPSTFGTGTEDYFGYAWCDPSIFASAYHAQPQCDGPKNFGYTCVNRFQIPDAVPFQKSFLFDLEIWHWRDVHVDYATTAWWYGKRGVKSGLPTVPRASLRTPDPVKADDGFVARGAIEGETMKVLAMTGGESKVQLMGWYDDRVWSNGRHRWWLKGKVGDKLTLAVPVPAKGRYRVEAVLTRARDYGIVQLRLNGRPLGKPIDLFSAHAVEPTRRLALGEIEIDEGEAKFEIEITGKNPGSTGHMAGVDYVRLEPIR